MTRGIVGVGVVGLGEMGRVHAGHLAVGVPRARLVHVADADLATARAAGERLGVRWSTSLESMLEHPVDAVVIATPPPSHPSLIAAAAHAGKAIFCEKPLAGTAAAACTAVEAVERAGAILQIGFQRRFDPSFAAAQRRVESGELGPIRLYLSSMRSQAPPSLTALESGEHRLLFDAGCHELDASRWLVGEVDEVTVAADPSPPSSAILALRFANGALGSIDLTYFAGYGFDCRSEIVAEHATLRIHARNANDLELLSSGGSSRPLQRTFLERFRKAYRLELVAFVDSVVTGQAPAVTGEDGLVAQCLCEAAELSRLEGCSVRMGLRTTASGLTYPVPVTRGASSESPAIPG
jgi:predicted dehydrogenase